MTELNNERADVYTRVTEKIIADLENGVRDGHSRALPADAVRNRGTATRICSPPFATTWRARRGPARGTARSGRGCG